MNPRVAHCLAATLAFAVARATAAQEPSPGDMAQARELYNAGQDQRDSGDNLGALEKFKAANALAATPLTGLELGRIYSRLGRLVEAEEAYLAVARIPVRAEETTRSSAARRDAEKAAKDLRGHIPTLTIKVTGVASETLAVTLDGVALPTQALDAPRQVDPGPHAVSARSTKGGAAETHVDLKDGESKTVELTITFRGESPAPPPPVAALPAPAPTPSTGTNTMRTLGLVGGGVGLASLVVGGIFEALAAQATSAQQSACPSATNCPDYAGARSDHSRFQADSVVGATGLVAGGVLLAGGVTLFLLGNGSEREKAGVLVSPTGITFRGGF